MSKMKFTSYDQETWCCSGRVQESGARGPVFDTFLHWEVSMSELSMLWVITQEVVA